ncbi:hypothetical protein BJX62DRAFT_56641 [Aspergillus germanicus]
MVECVALLTAPSGKCCPETPSAVSTSVVGKSVALAPWNCCQASSENLASYHHQLIPLFDGHRLRLRFLNVVCVDVPPMIRWWQSVSPNSQSPHGPWPMGLKRPPWISEHNSSTVRLFSLSERFLARRTNILERAQTGRRLRNDRRRNWTSHIRSARGSTRSCSGWSIPCMRGSSCHLSESQDPPASRQFGSTNFLSRRAAADWLHVVIGPGPCARPFRRVSRVQHWSMAISTILVQLHKSHHPLFEERAFAFRRLIGLEPLTGK